MPPKRAKLHTHAVSDRETVHRFIRAIEDAEAKRRGVGKNEARISLARRLRTSPGTLLNLRRSRTKTVTNWLMNRIREEFVSILQKEIARLEIEILIARQTDPNNCDDALSSAEAHLEKAREVLKGRDHGLS